MKYLVRVIMMAILFTGLFSAPNCYIKASTKNITKAEFIRDIVTELKLDISDTSSDPYILAALKAGILKEEDFDKNYIGYITRTDAAVLLNRADEYLHGDTVDAGLLDIVLNKRISDINKVLKEKRDAVAKCFVKGIIKGYSNGAFTSNRAFRGSEYLTKTTAKAYINLVTNKVKRAKLSPDGQLIRTTNLPKYAKYYPYILASYKNGYYDWQFRYENQAYTDPETGVRTPLVKYEEFASPAEIDKITDYENFKEVKEEYLDLWVNKVKIYMECVFNVDYRTINDNWVNKLLSVDYSYGHDNITESEKEKIENYIKNMKKNKTIVESANIAVDGSSLYYCNEGYVLRVYVKYKIISSIEKPGADADVLIYENPYGKILYTRYPIVNLRNYTLGKWKESYFDVELSWYYQKDPSNIGVISAVLNEFLYEKRRVDK